MNKWLFDCCPPGIHPTHSVIAKKEAIVSISSQQHLFNGDMKCFPHVHNWSTSMVKCILTKLYLFTPRSLARCRFSFSHILRYSPSELLADGRTTRCSKQQKGWCRLSKAHEFPQTQQPWNKQLVQLVSFPPWTWPNFSIFHQPRFPWKSRGFPETSATFWGAQVMWGCYRWMKHINETNMRKDHSRIKVRIEQHEQQRNWRTTSPKTSKLVVFFDARKTSLYTKVRC